jgi:hypothetical protein
MQQGSPRLTTRQPRAGRVFTSGSTKAMNCLVDDSYLGQLTTTMLAGERPQPGRSWGAGLPLDLRKRIEVNGMLGKRITDHQGHKYKQHRNKLSQVASAAKAGISERSARRIEGAQSLSSQRPARNWRTREDSLSAVWDREVIPLLQTDTRLNAVTLLEELQRRYPGQWDTSVLRTLWRRTRLWRAKFWGRAGGLLCAGTPTRTPRHLGLHRGG